MSLFLLFALLFQPQFTVPETECEQAARLIESYNAQLCELYAKVLIQERVVSELSDAYRDAVQLRQNNARAAQVLLDILQVRALTPSEAELLTELLAEGIVLERQVQDADAALKAAEAELGVLKSRMLTMARLMNEKRAWYEENCGPISPDPDPSPEPDPNFP